tara:strand:+ start:611 stop:2101 length:1491 start_codon:yes stop_codon:yes gene_type:complete
MVIKLNQEKKEFIILIIFSSIFALTVQQNYLFQGNHAHLIHSLKNINLVDLNNDWISSITNHVPIFTFFNYIFIKFFSINIIHILHFLLLITTAISIFYICKKFLNKIDFSVYCFWFGFFIILFNEKTFFNGVAGQGVLNHVYQPSSFGVLFFLSFALFIYGKYYLSILSLAASVYFHPTYLLHSGFFLIGYILFLVSKNEKIIFNIIITYLVLILPVVFFLFNNFVIFDNTINTEAQKILVENRIPHHANIYSWLSIKDLRPVILISISLYLVKNVKEIFIPLLSVFLLSISLSIIQYIINNYWLALLFPWRSFVFLVPISSLIIVSFVLNLDYGRFSKFSKFTHPIFFVFIFLSWFTISKIDSSIDNLAFKKNSEIYNYLKSNKNDIKKLLVPLDLLDIRLNTGIPIFVDWKHHAFKNDEIIHWYKRVKLNESFYNSNNYKDMLAILREIKKIDEISHVIFRKSNKTNDFRMCEKFGVFNDYIIYNLKLCKPKL